MNFNISDIKKYIFKAYGRLKWATFSRKDRIRREKAYSNLALGYEQMVVRMWERLGAPNTQPPELGFMFDKKNACAAFWFSHYKDGKSSRSNVWIAGDINDPNQPAKLVNLNTLEAIPYYISDEIIAATAIAVLISDEDTVDQEIVNNTLARYYESQDYNPIELSTVWLSRLNSTVCSIWQFAPIMKRTLEIMEEKKIKMKDAQIIAMDEVVIADLPQCMNSNNGDGRMNMSYGNSKFYTIDHHGIAICEEFPSELLNLNDYAMMRTVASTIYRDITGNDDLNDLGISGANMILEEEPEWKDGNIFPWERQGEASN